MRLPRTVIIGDVKWRVRLFDNENYDGLTHKEDHLIEINRRLNQRERLVTLLHEVLHVCCHQSGIGEKKFTEEEFISHVQYPLSSFIKRYRYLWDE